MISNCENAEAPLRAANREIGNSLLTGLHYVQDTYSNKDQGEEEEPEHQATTYKANSS